jgi:hypothetical protein
MPTICLILLVSVSACGPKDVIPNAPSHPANPDAPAGAPAVAGMPPNAAAPAQPPKGHEGHGDHGAPPPAADDKLALAAAEKAAFEKARPILMKNCAHCHTSKGEKANKKKLDHFNMDTYPFGGHHATTMGKTIREVLGVAGKEATMPKDDPGAIKGADLDAIVEWTKAFDKSHEAGLHQHGDHGHEHGHGDHH